jgi:hypothetical protein
MELRLRGINKHAARRGERGGERMAKRKLTLYDVETIETPTQATLFREMRTQMRILAAERQTLLKRQSDLELECSRVRVELEANRVLLDDIDVCLDSIFESVVDQNNPGLLYHQPRDQGMALPSVTALTTLPPPMQRQLTETLDRRHTNIYGGGCWYETLRQTADELYDDDDDDNDNNIDDDLDDPGY